MDVPPEHPHAADPWTFLEEVCPQILKKLKEELKALGGVKFQLALKVQLQKVRADGTKEFSDPVFRHKQEALLQASEMKEALDSHPTSWSCSKNGHRDSRSGWSTECTLWLDIARYQPLRGGSYIPLPAAVKNKKAVVNVKSKDDNCLRRALRLALFPVAKDPQRSSKYPLQDGLHFEGVDAHTPISQIPQNLSSREAK